MRPTSRRLSEGTREQSERHPGRGRAARRRRARGRRGVDLARQARQRAGGRGAVSAHSRSPTSASPQVGRAPTELRRRGASRPARAQGRRRGGAPRRGPRPRRGAEALRSGHARAVRSARYAGACPRGHPRARWPWQAEQASLARARLAVVPSAVRRSCTRLMVDLGEVRAFDYYTGLRQQAWALGSARPLVVGAATRRRGGLRGRARRARGLARRRRGGQSRGERAVMMAIHSREPQARALATARGRGRAGRRSARIQAGRPRGSSPGRGRRGRRTGGIGARAGRELVGIRQPGAWRRARGERSTTTSDRGRRTAGRRGQGKRGQLPHQPGGTGGALRRRQQRQAQAW